MTSERNEAEAAGMAASAQGDADAALAQRI